MLAGCAQCNKVGLCAEGRGSGSSQEGARPSCEGQEGPQEVQAREWGAAQQHAPGQTQDWSMTNRCHISLANMMAGFLCDDCCLVCVKTE